ncbi:MAG: hypothetical protein KA248_06310 [Kiritimatiellae bacterium]|nr:hypothetical protein [Kiritimatiellia bacterium]
MHARRFSRKGTRRPGKPDAGRVHDKRSAALTKRALAITAMLAVCLGPAAGRAQGTPAVSNVIVLSTEPDNGAVPYNTGAATIRIVGSGFSTVTGTNGVTLDDLNGHDDPVRTAATNYTVDSDAQITATFPPGIRTRGTAGWNVIVTNSAGANTNSLEKFVPRAGLLISEIFIGMTNAADHEFVEVYNPTASRLNASTLGLRFYVLYDDGNGGAKGLTKVTDGNIPAHGFLLLVSSNAASESWATNRDYLWSAGSPTLGKNSGVYISLSSVPDVKVIDKVGWGSEAQYGYEGVRLPGMTNGFSAERRPAAGWGHATDTDTNKNDFLSQSTNITPRGSADALEPPAPASIVIADNPAFSGGPFLVEGTASTNLPLSVRCSPDLATAFTIIGTATADVSGVFSYSDTNADAVAKRYYRVTYP